ncbi:hypothetical protein FRC03_004167 [Tulasnella sp. 419]|nr:hypothetical protein FRC02_011988 [Tulasnella sp. 418]KAG8962529.1 hypothetical protein FRC03_004167 [Tulasnella sp. 419]
MGILATLILLTILSSGANAQEEINRCFQGSTWWHSLNNTRGQDPCQIVLEARNSVTRTAVLTGIPLTDFDGQTISSLCTDKAYKLYGACNACRFSEKGALEAAMPPMNEWKACTASNNNAIDPFNTTTPEWTSRMTMQPNEIFNIEKALAASHGITPPEGGSAVPTSDTGGRTTMAGGSLPTATLGSSDDQTPTTGSSRSSKSNNIGAIVGGIVGGVVLLALVLGLFLVYRRRKQNRVAPSAEFAKYHAKPSLQPMHRPPMAEADQPRRSASTAGYAPLGSTSPPPAPEENGDVLPAFTPGHYNGPVFEKGGHVSDPNSPSTNASHPTSSSRAGHSGV